MSLRGYAFLSIIAFCAAMWWLLISAIFAPRQDCTSFDGALPAGHECEYKVMTAR